ncbi:uncharacterized protein B0P05DRAFT_535757 [Gilbertella persicaria]|uniref:uncharacterized protein n=1 Tax=Gilbertella persicaria TaxID=101096 RepID=UPI0022205FD1|nr:uncharacterized protein B0P05DRAFT_535757 [Gilbertella persicaria]KAI8083991.1 hypothetical protein B0P05DRAFT_535757 [Gilbertella persicaria]
MPIPVMLDPHRLVQTILASRLGHQHCLATQQQHHHHACYFDQSVLNEAGLVINILQMESDILLERWMLSVWHGPQLSFEQEIADFIGEYPLRKDQVYAILFDHDTPSYQCYSAQSIQTTIEFQSDAQLKAKRFQLAGVCIEVIFDQHKPSLVPWQSLSLDPLASNTPVIAIRRLSRLSLSALEEEEEKEDDHLTSGYAIPIPTPRMQYTHHHRSTTLAYSTSPTPRHFHEANERRHSLTTDILHHHGSLVGSFEESLLSGRMSSMPSKPITFHCQMGVLGYGNCKPSLKCPPHWSIVFPATFYHLPDHDEDTTTTTPYVGIVDLEEYASQFNQPGYRIPPKGQIQVVVKNPNKTAVKLFLIPYDFTDMPRNTKTFLRQKSYVTEGNKQLLRYAIHLQFCRTDKKRIYLFKTMRIVFANRKADTREKFHVVCEGPKAPVFIPQ